MEQQGWIKLHRKIVDWQWYKDIPCRILFEHLLLTANHKPAKWRLYDIEEGQKITSLESLAFETGLTVAQVRYALGKLKKTGDLASISTSKFSIITVTNYKSYQSLDKPISKPVANESQTNDKPVATNKNNKNKKNENNVSIENLSVSIFTAEELSQLAIRYPAVDFTELIETMKNYCLASGKRYKDYKAALHNWAKKEQQEKNNAINKQSNRQNNQPSYARKSNSETIADQLAELHAKYEREHIQPGG